MDSSGGSESSARAPRGIFVKKGASRVSSPDGDAWTRSEHVRQDLDLLRWCRVQLGRASLTYQKEGHIYSADGSFPQWSCKAGQDCLLALGRVRPPALGEEGFDAVVEVAFRGTENNDNWATNLQAAMMDNFLGSQQGGIHRGFAEAYQLLRKDIKRHVGAALAAMGCPLGPNVLVLATGHSLGGALATLCAYDLGSNGCSAVCVTFGAPRVGNETFVRSFLDEVGRNIRFVNKFDQVPRLPPTTSEPIRNDADLVHSGVGALMGALGLTKKCGAEGYCHAGPQTQLDACGLNSSIDHWANVALAASQALQPRPAAAKGDASPGSSATGPAPTTTAQEAVDMDAVVPHFITVYEKNVDNLLAGNTAARAGGSSDAAAKLAGALLSFAQKKPAAPVQATAAQRSAPPAAAALRTSSTPSEGWWSFQKEA